MADEEELTLRQRAGKIAEKIAQDYRQPLQDLTELKLSDTPEESEKQKKLLTATGAAAGSAYVTGIFGMAWNAVAKTVNSVIDVPNKAAGYVLGFRPKNLAVLPTFKEEKGLLTKWVVPDAVSRSNDYAWGRSWWGSAEEREAKRIVSKARDVIDRLPDPSFEREFMVASSILSGEDAHALAQLRANPKASELFGINKDMKASKAVSNAFVVPGAHSQAYVNALIENAENILDRIPITANIEETVKKLSSNDRAILKLAIRNNDVRVEINEWANGRAGSPGRDAFTKLQAVAATNPRGPQMGAPPLPAHRQPHPDFINAPQQEYPIAAELDAEPSYSRKPLRNGAGKPVAYVDENKVIHLAAGAAEQELFDILAPNGKPTARFNTLIKDGYRLDPDMGLPPHLGFAAATGHSPATPKRTEGFFIVKPEEAQRAAAAIEAEPHIQQRGITIEQYPVRIDEKFLSEIGHEAAQGFRKKLGETVVFLRSSDPDFHLGGEEIGCLEPERISPGAFRQPDAAQIVRDASARTVSPQTKPPVAHPVAPETAHAAKPASEAVKIRVDSKEHGENFVKKIHDSHSAPNTAAGNIAVRPDGEKWYVLVKKDYLEGFSKDDLRQLHAHAKRPAVSQAAPTHAAAPKTLAETVKTAFQSQSEFEIPMANEAHARAFAKTLVNEHSVGASPHLNYNNNQWTIAVNARDLAFVDITPEQIITMHTNTQAAAPKTGQASAKRSPNIPNGPDEPGAHGLNANPNRGRGVDIDASPEDLPRSRLTPQESLAKKNMAKNRLPPVAETPHVAATPHNSVPHEPSVHTAKPAAIKGKLGKAGGALGTLIAGIQATKGGYDILNGEGTAGEKAERLAELGVGLGLDAGANAVTFGLSGGAASTLALGTKKLTIDAIGIYSENQKLEEDYAAGKLAFKEYDRKMATLVSRAEALQSDYKQLGLDTLKATTPGTIATGLPEIEKTGIETLAITVKEEFFRFKESPDLNNLMYAQRQLHDKLAASGATFDGDGNIDLGKKENRDILKSTLSREALKLKIYTKSIDGTAVTGNPLVSTFITRPLMPLFDKITGKHVTDRYNESAAQQKIYDLARKELTATGLDKRLDDMEKRNAWLRSVDAAATVDNPGIGDPKPGEKDTAVKAPAVASAKEPSASKSNHL